MSSSYTRIYALYPFGILFVPCTLNEYIVTFLVTVDGVLD
jgi:hypothetical protein